MRAAGLFVAAPALLAVLLTATVARAEGMTATEAPCGGDAFSSAQVIEKRPPRRGPLTATPDTLCADLAPQRPAAGIEVYPQVYPLLPHGNGPRRTRAPY